MSEREIITKLLRESPNPAFMDLGAHVGSDTVWLWKAAGKPVKGVAVEPDPENFKTLSSIGLPIPTIWAAISAHSGSCDFHVCDGPADGRGSGSIREPTGHRVRHGVPYHFHKIEVPCFSLDDLFAKYHFDHLDILWTDIQGGEKDMIQGGQKTLKATRYLFIESEYAEEFYAGQAMRPELLAMLPDWVIEENYDFNLLLRNEKYQAPE